MPEQVQTAMVAIVVIVTISFLATLYLSASAQTYEDGLQFYPEVPTEKNHITATVSLTAPTPCHKVELQDFAIDGRNLSINVQVTPPPADIACILVLKQHAIKQDIGTLAAGAYTARLYVNGEEKAASRLYVSANDVAVISTGRYTDDQGGVNLVGEVQNTASRPIKLVRVDVAFFEGDQLVEEERTYTTMAMIMPNRTSGFSLALRDDLVDKDYSVRVTSYSEASNPPEKALRLVVEPRVEDRQAEVVGSVTNVGSRNATQVKVVCVLYDSSRNAIDSVFGYTDPDSMAPGMGAEFRLIPHHAITEEFTASCNAESIELAVQEVRIVPEFPAAISIIVAGSLAAALAIGRIRNKL